MLEILSEKAKSYTQKLLKNVKTAENQNFPAFIFQCPAETILLYQNSTTLQ
jgi:hypothetical protein